MLSRFLNVFVGFIFWIVAAKFYSIEDVGIATALISSLYIIISFSRFGFDFSLIRFIRLHNKSNALNTSLTITTIGSLIVGVIYLVGIKFFSPDIFLDQKLSYIIVFLLFVFMSSIVSITGVAFTAVRQVDYYLFQNILLAFRVPLLIPLAFLGSFGIFGSVGLAYLLSALLSVLQLTRTMKFDFKIDNQFIKKSFKFSSGNYASNVFFTVPTYILPILVLSLLGEAEAAKYYIAFSIGGLVLIIPEALCTSLFVEGSHGENLKKNAIRALGIIYSLLIPAIVLVYLFGENFLALVGKDYVDALELLKFLAISSTIAPIYYLYISIQNIQMHVENNVKLNLLLFLLLPSLSYLLIIKFGIIGAGYAWMITYGILDLIIIVQAKKSEWL